MMRSACSLAALLLVLGCSTTPPAYSPETFRSNVEQLIQSKRYEVAVSYVRSADPERQADFDKVGYLAVGEFDIVLPGVPSTVHFDMSRDWFMPGTSDVIENEEWQLASTEFAAAYNQKRGRTH